MLTAMRAHMALQHIPECRYLHLDRTMPSMSPSLAAMAHSPASLNIPMRRYSSQRSPWSARRLTSAGLPQPAHALRRHRPNRSWTIHYPSLSGST
jgi:hypothetical protein